MTRCLNRAELIGHLGDAPVIRMLESGQAMATFAVATSWRWQDATTRRRRRRSGVGAWSSGRWRSTVARCCNAARGCMSVAGCGHAPWEDTSGVTRERTEMVAHEVLPLTVSGGRQAACRSAPRN